MVKSGLVLACVALAQWVSAQQAPQMEALPIDPNVRYGVLDNGLTYYVRHNETPKKSCRIPHCTKGRFNSRKRRPTRIGPLPRTHGIQRDRTFSR